MPAKQIAARAKALKRTAPNALKTEVQSVLATLKRLGNPRFRAEMEPRYGIVTKDAFGVRMNEMQRVAKQLGRNHELAIALWETGNYEARTVAAFVAEPERLTPTLMDRWCRDFDNWGICDTVCFKLFDQSPHAFGRVAAWAKRKDEFQKRAAFALLACLALHDEPADDKSFTELLPLIETATTDERNFVKKGVSWALRAIGVRSAALNSTATALARRLASSEDVTSRWIGKDALRALNGRKAPSGATTMSADEFRAAALKTPGAIEAVHMKHPDFRVNGKIFASLGYPDDGWGMVKLTPEQQRAFMKEAPETFTPCAGAWGRGGATSVHLASAKRRILSKALRTAAQNILDPNKS